MERKTTYQRLREAGLCVTCRAPAVPGKSKCEACAKKSVERTSRWYKQHKEESKAYWRKRYFNNCIAGKCPLCGAPAEEGHTACRACMDKNKQRYHTIIALREYVHDAAKMLLLKGMRYASIALTNLNNGGR